MKHLTISVDTAAATAKTVVVPFFDTSRPVSVLVVPSAAPGATASVVVKPAGGNNMFTGNLSATAKTPSKLTKTTTLADAAQTVSSTTPLEIDITTTNAITVGITIKVDDHLICQEGA